MSATICGSQGKDYIRSCFALREHPVFETPLVRAKHSDYQLLVLTERLFARMLRPYIIGMLTALPQALATDNL
jgi:predicted membrane-bound spermidine synthase